MELAYILYFPDGAIRHQSAAETGLSTGTTLFFGRREWPRRVTFGRFETMADFSTGAIRSRYS